ncbi:hypothetical protein M8037_18365, partial [Sinorhizobium meliloti]|nr:hypothetical protein [Sinorhizobium meliloti]
LVDLTTPTTTSSDARIGPFDPTASSEVDNGSVLGATEWLRDAHIQRDYHLLEAQLQRVNPRLAARIRLVDPSVSHLLRDMPPQNARGTLQSIYNQNGTPADFLFLPVSNGTPMSPGHWSLLLVDRRNPERQFADHYNSLQGEGQNDVPAKQLAGRYCQVVCLWFRGGEAGGVSSNHFCSKIGPQAEGICPCVAI